MGHEGKAAVGLWAVVVVHVVVATAALAVPAIGAFAAARAHSHSVGWWVACQVAGVIPAVWLARRAGRIVGRAGL